MSKLTDEQILGAIKSCPPVKHDYAGWVRDLRLLWGRAIESAATEPLLQRIAELEQRNSDLYEDVQRFKKHALNEKAARLELERQLHEQAVSLEEARKDAERLDWLVLNPVETLDLFGCVKGDFSNWPKWIRKDIDAVMQKGQS